MGKELSLLGAPKIHLALSQQIFIHNKCAGLQRIRPLVNEDGEHSRAWKNAASQEMLLMQAVALLDIKFNCDNEQFSFIFQA